MENVFLDCIENFRRFDYKCEYNVKIVRAEDGEKVAYFTTTNGYKNIFGAIAEKNEFDEDVREYEQRECRFNFESIKKYQKFFHIS